MDILSHPTAAQIAFALDKPRQVGSDRYQACCPCHEDKSPSFSIEQSGDRVLFYCFGGCSQTDVIDALRTRGLWPEERKTADVKTLVDRNELLACCLAHEFNLKRGTATSTKHQRLYRQYQRVLCSPFTPDEIAEMHLFCLLYQSDVRGGGTPTAGDDSTFMDYQRAVHLTEYAPDAW